jgi:chromosome segregation ATPase
MIKKIVIGLFAFLVIFLISFSDTHAKVLQEKEVELKIRELREKIQELAVKIERNPEAVEAEKWRDQRRKYINELERLLALSREKVQETKYTDLEWAVKQSQEKLHELESAIESLKKKGESEEKIKVYQERMAEEEQRLEELIHRNELRRTGQRTEGAERERYAQRIREEIQELRAGIEQDPDSEEAQRWRGMLKEWEQELERIQRGGEFERPERRGRFPEIEAAIRRTQDQLKELELYIEDLRKKKENEEKIHDAEVRIVQKRKELAEFKSLMERRQRQVDEPSAYQRERGELTASVISSSENDVTVRVKDSGRVMVLRVRKWRRVEGRRVENREEMNFVKRLKKDELIWVNYTEGEERGSFFILEIKRVGK